ncbi:MAG TPA: zinc-dependent alcohol dehydrogenase family protein [Vicinamibacteria bacterium]|nr:zinc-dependent alcohol dehydrogenase family protein [Vicinamibacteria bacterium]
MKAMVLSEQRPMADSPLTLLDLPVPEPGEGEIRIKVSCCAICRTDLHVIEGDLPPRKLPLVPGHQVVGTVDKLGPGSSLEMGQRVGVAWLHRCCETCDFCTSGRENLCESPTFTGYHVDGGYGEYVTAPEAYVYEIPGVFTDHEAAPLLCSGIIGYRSLRRSQLKPGQTLGICGFGSSAHVVIQIARHWGCRVLVATRGEGHRDLASRLGAEWTGERPEDFPEAVDSAILFAPAGELVPPLLEKVRPGGTLAIAGIYLSDVPSLSYEGHLFHERNIHSVTANTRRDGHELLDVAAKIPIRPHTVVYPLDEANRALQDLEQDRLNGTGVLTVSSSS